MIDAFQHDRDIYASIASIAFGVPYEKCLEFHPETHEYQPDGKQRRGEAKTIVLGICYGRSVPSIGDQLYGTRDDMSDEDKTKAAQKVYDSVLNAFPNLRQLMINAQGTARKYGYVTTILGRRRHIPSMQLPEFEFRAMDGYVNPDVDPLDLSTLSAQSDIPDRIIAQLTKEFKGYKYFGQIVKRTKELQEQKIRVINNRTLINDGSRQCVNSIIQGSAAEQTKLAMLILESDSEWREIGGRLILPVHDELIAEVPAEHWERGGAVLSRCMCEAASFLPFPSKCDVTTTYRWYGLAYPCKYPQPESLDTTDPEEIKWIQYHLTEMEYELPIIYDESGSKPRGDAAVGVNGTRTPQMENAISAYIHRYQLSKDKFIQHIHHQVDKGELL